MKKEQVNEFIEKIKNLSEDDFAKYINLLYQEGLISEHSD